MRHLSGDEELDVPSPTFLLDHSYPVTLPAARSASDNPHSTCAARPQHGALHAIQSAQLGQASEGAAAQESSKQGTPPEASVHLHHIDLYRLLQDGQGDAAPAHDAAQRIGRLELQQSCSDGVCLIEWPEGLPFGMPRSLKLHIEELTKVRLCCGAGHYLIAG